MTFSAKLGPRTAMLQDRNSVNFGPGNVKTGIVLDVLFLFLKLGEHPKIGKAMG
jgi:hypothetical protein